MMKTMKRSKDKPTGILISIKMLILILYDNVKRVRKYLIPSEIPQVYKQ